MRSLGAFVTLLFSVGCPHPPVPEDRYLPAPASMRVDASESSSGTGYRVECGVGAMVGEPSDDPRIAAVFLRVVASELETCFFPFWGEPSLATLPAEDEQSLQISVDWSYAGIGASPIDGQFPREGQPVNKTVIWRLLPPSSVFDVDLTCAVGVYSPCPRSRGEFEAAGPVTVRVRGVVSLE